MSDFEHLSEFSASWNRKSDMQLAEIIRESGDRNEQSQALEVLQSRHNSRIRSLMYSRLPVELIDDAVLHVWMEFFTSTSKHQITDGVGQYLYGIARNCRADAVKKMTAERDIESNIPSESLGGLSSVEGEEMKRFMLDPSVEAMYKVSFIDKVLSPCQRVLWSMHVVQAYSPTPVARLLGKNVNIVSSGSSQAMSRVLEKINSDAYQMAASIREIPLLWQPDVLAENSLFIERFSEPLKPDLTPDELKPLGLSLEELHTNYEISLIAPRWYDEGFSTTTPPSLLLTQKLDYEHLQKLYDKIKADPDDLPDEFPEECLVKVNIIEKDIELRVEPLMQIFPDPDYLYGADHYLMFHTSRMKLPVVVATHDEELSALSGDKKKWSPLYPRKCCH